MDDLFPETIPVSANIEMRHPCRRCGDSIAITGPGKEPHAASLTCKGCGKRRGWLGKAAAKYIKEIRGTPNVPETFRADVLAQACAKQDEHLELKLTPEGVSWFDVISNNFN
jgi:hypothetical protein